jgi:hypothetical protein
MNVLDAIHGHLADMLTEGEALLAGYRKRLEDFDAAVAAEAAKVPTVDEIKAMLDKLMAPAAAPVAEPTEAPVG